MYKYGSFLSFMEHNLVSYRSNIYQVVLLLSFLDWAIIRLQHLQFLLTLKQFHQGKV